MPQESIKKQITPSYSHSREDNEQLYIKSKKKINNYRTRAGGLAWLRYRLDMAGVVGSNPTRPIYEIKLISLELLKFSCWKLHCWWRTRVVYDFRFRMDETYFSDKSWRQTIYN